MKFLLVALLFAFGAGSNAFAKQDKEVDCDQIVAAVAAKKAAAANNSGNAEEDDKKPSGAKTAE